MERKDEVSEDEGREPAPKKNRFDYMDAFFATRASSSVTSDDYCAPSTSRRALEAQRIPSPPNVRNEVIRPQENRNFYLISELMHRQYGLYSDGRRLLRSGNCTGFENRFWASRHVVNKMDLYHSLSPGSGSIQPKTLNFNKVGNLLCSSSPMTESTIVQVWNWGLNTLRLSYDSGCAIGRITDLKFIYPNGSMNIVSAHADGEVVLAEIPPSGGDVSITELYKRTQSFCKLAPCPQNPHMILSGDTDGRITMCDIRKPQKALCLKIVKGGKYLAQLFSISHHPFNHEICVGCGDNFIRVFDVRKMTRAIHTMCPQSFIDKDYDCMKCTAMYNKTGNEILGSYSYKGHYLFDNKKYIPGSFIRRYSGHFPKDRPNKIEKGYPSNAKFFGPNSEYVISSSDLGSICVWNTNTAEIVRVIGSEIDEDYFEPHPSIPILASCRSEPDNMIRIWAPLDQRLEDNI